MLAWDTETDLIRPGVLAPELACVSYSDGQRAELVHGDDARSHLEWLLRQETTTANGPFDLAVAWSWFPELGPLIWDAVLSGRVHDIFTRQKLIDIGEGQYRFYFANIEGARRKLGYSLSDLHARYFGSFMEKDEWRKTYGALRAIPVQAWAEGARKYAMLDAMATSRIHVQQNQRQPRMRRDPSAYLHNEIAQVQASWVLHLMGARGVATDDWQVRRVIENIDAEQPQLREILLRAGLVDRGGKRKDKRARKLMYQAVGAAGELTEAGEKRVKQGLMTKDEALREGFIKVDEEWCEASGNPDLRAYDAYTQNQLLRSKIVNFKTGALPLHTRYEVMLETGRTSSSEDKLVFNSAATQNLPRKEGMRESIVARKGYALIASDFGQAELVSLAQVTYNWFEKGRSCNDPWYCKSQMRDTLNRGIDIHLDFAADMLSISYEEALSRYKNDDAEAIEARQMAKAANFGLPGGLSVDSLISYAKKNYGVTLTPQKAKWLYNRWLKKFPEMKMYFRAIRKLFNQRITLEDLLDDNDVEQNRKFKLADMTQEMSGRIRGKCLYTQACNTMFQGLTADAGKAALVEVSRRCYTDPTSALYGSFPVLYIHDEIILETPEEKITEAAKELEEIMVMMYSRFTPDVRITADAHAMHRWSKKAKELRDKTRTDKDSRGALLVWRDEKFEAKLYEYAKAKGLSRGPERTAA